MVYQKGDHPYVEQVRLQKDSSNLKSVLIMDCLRGQCQDLIMTTQEENDIFVVFVPASTTDRLQPLDLSVNKSAKEFLRENFRQW